MIKYRPKIYIILILLLAATLRLYGINWDQGHHLHPDERMIIMVADSLSFPDNLNPKFFAYGSFPIYLLKFVSWLAGADNYGGMLAVGRLLSATFDVGTVFLVYLIARKVAPRTLNLEPLTTATLSAFFYAVAVLPIQSSHFFISDIPLTFFTTLTLLFCLKLVSTNNNVHKNYVHKNYVHKNYVHKNNLKNKPSTFFDKINDILKNVKIYRITNCQLSISIAIAASFGLALATKLTGIFLIVPIALAILLSKFQTANYQRFANWKIAILSLFGIWILGFGMFLIAMPYAILDFPTFKAQILTQSHMRSNPFIFPYTLQYVGTKPYWYFVKNLVLWGLGLPLGVLAVLGTIYSIVRLLHCSIVPLLKRNSNRAIEQSSNLLIFILSSFFWVYFIFIGKSAVKFMRYLLPLYPLLAIFAAQLSTQLYKNLKKLLLTPLPQLLIISYQLLIILWPLAFISIYSRPHTRIAASEWIYQNISAGSTLAVEHWDDRLPLNLHAYKSNIADKATLPLEASLYNFVELPLYDADTPEKWRSINEKLENTDFIIIASNRLYTPLMKLTNCEELPPGKCYPQTAQYYRDLFTGTRGFTKVAEFTSFPRLDFGFWILDFRDEFADESFTVYDHPKVIIFKSQPAVLKSRQ